MRWLTVARGRRAGTLERVRRIREVKPNLSYYRSWLVGLAGALSKANEDDDTILSVLHGK